MTFWYLGAEWFHDTPEDPVFFYSEIDEEGFERRKVEVFADGSLRFADEKHFDETIELSYIPVPSIEELQSAYEEDLEVRTFVMTKEDFEKVWLQAVQNQGKVADAQSD